MNEFVQINGRPETRVPYITVDTLYNFLLGYQPGGFTSAVLDGKPLTEIVVKADIQNQQCLGGIGLLLCRFFPHAGLVGVDRYFKSTSQEEKNACARQFREEVIRVYGYDVDPEGQKQ